MTNEELVLEVKRLEEQIKDLKIKLEEKAEKKPYEVEVPEDIDDYVYINNAGNTFDLNTLTIVGFEEIFKRGLAFKTREEAEQFDKERILLFKMHKWAEEHNGGWTPNWKDLYENKHSVTYDYEENKFHTRSSWCETAFSKLPHFISNDIAEQFIEEFGEDIKEVLC